MDTRPAIRPKDRRKVKTGCRTCKIRRIKCDEARPSCQKCVSTGRTCDGYGIWTRAAALPGRHNDRPLAPRIARHVAALPTGTIKVTGQEQSGFEWFLVRCRTKLAGVFESELWATALSQASWAEPAVMQAILALSLAHKRDVLPEGQRPRESAGRRIRQAALDEQEQAALQHYGRAIRLLQPHFSANNKSSIRVAVITCLIFVYLQLLRQQHKTAHALLQTGLTLLRGLQPRPEGDVTLVLSTQQHTMDDCLADAFIRLDIQMALMGHGSQQRYVIVLDPEPVSPVFVSAQVARQQLDAILYGILLLAHIFRHPEMAEDPHLASGMRNSQKSMQAALSSWLETYNATQAASARTNIGARDDMGYRLLLIYHTMACVMVATCSSPGDESVFDYHKNSFASIVAQCAELIERVTAPFTIFSIFLGSCPERVSFFPDMGVIAPLYFTALKCRVRRIRLLAIEQLISTGYHEGIWNGKAVGGVAWKVAQLEHVGTADATMPDFMPASRCDNGDTGPTPPTITRVADVCPRLSDDSPESIIFSYRQARSDSGWDAVERLCTVNRPS